MASGLTIVSNRLPISVKKTGTELEFFDSIGGLATGMSGLTKDKRNKWVGWPGIPSDQLTEADKQKITKKLLSRNCYPVFLTQKQLDNFYNGYSNQVLWPLLHSLNASKISDKKYQSYWKSYQQVNNIYADAVINLNNHGNHIWVHDYQLMLLPNLIRQQLPNTKVGYFLHVPFPKFNNTFPTEINYLINGLLGADLVGFHIDDYANSYINFCNKLGYTVAGSDGISVDKRLVKVASFPMGIDFDKFSTTINKPAVKKELKILFKKYQNQKVVLTIDRVDPTKGLIERLSAYHQFLKQNKSTKEKFVMIMVAVPSRIEVKEYQILHHNLENLVNVINQEFQTLTWKPIDFIYDSLPFNQIAALYQIADIAFIAPLIDGMNLVAKEYIASRKESGVLILSKTAGAAKELTDALIVDPNNPKSLVKALSDAISMPKIEQKKRLNKMQQQVSKFTIKKWLDEFTKNLNKSPNHKNDITKSLSKRWQNKLLDSYSNASKRALLLDYDGVLAPFVINPKQAKPTAKLKLTLTKLTSNKKNTVVIISGRGKEDLDKWFNRIPITIVVEHGNIVRSDNDSNWYAVNNYSNYWKNEVIDILNIYVSKIPKSFIENKQTALVWHYRAANQTKIKQNLAELNISLLPLAQKYNLKIDQSNMILEIRLKAISKGQPALEYSKQSDFILAIGDDRTDEDMFEALPSNAWTIKVGPGYTSARFRLKNVDEVHTLLENMSH